MGALSRCTPAARLDHGRGEAQATATSRALAERIIDLNRSRNRIGLGRHDERTAGLDLTMADPIAMADDHCRTFNSANRLWSEPSREP